MATILHAYPNRWAMLEGFHACTQQGLHKRFPSPQIILNDGTVVKFAVVANGRDAECLAGLTLKEVFWHYQPTPELEARVNRWVRKPAE